MAPAAPAVRLRETVVLADRFPLLSGMTLEVSEGEIVHLGGPNGAGKTSLLRLCAGLLAPSSGEAEVLGLDLTRTDERRRLRREIGLLGHSSFLYGDLSPRENLTFALKAAGLDTGEARARTEAALDRMGITGRLATTPVVKLSAGQRRRTAIGVLVGRQPRLWLLDEPHAGLDQASRDLLDALVRATREAGSTVVFSSHEVGRAQAIADRVIELVGGQEVRRASPPAGNGTGGSGTGARRDAMTMGSARVP